MNLEVHIADVMTWITRCASITEVAGGDDLLSAIAALATAAPDRLEELTTREGGLVDQIRAAMPDAREKLRREKAVARATLSGSPRRPKAMNRRRRPGPVFAGTWAGGSSLSDLKVTHRFGLTLER